MGKVMFGGGKAGMKQPLKFDPVFANNTWEQIIEACQSGKVPDTWAVGDNKPMTINSASYQIDIIGKNHDTYTDGGTAPLTFQMHDLYSQAYNMSQTNGDTSGWKNLTMRTTYLPAIMALMPSEVQAGIKEVQKLAVINGTSTTLETVNDKLFLLSEQEVLGVNTNARNAEGSRYAYYAAGNSAIKRRNSSIEVWWTRSRSKMNNYTNWVCTISGSGGSSAANVYDSYNYVAPAFCF